MEVPRKKELRAHRVQRHKERGGGRRQLHLMVIVFGGDKKDIGARNGWDGRGRHNTMGRREKWKKRDG